MLMRIAIRLLRRPTFWAVLIFAVAAGWYFRPLDRSALFPARFAHGKWGFVSADGRVAIPPQWENAQEFKGDPFAPVLIGEKWGFIDRNGRTRIPPQWDDVWPFDRVGLAAVKKGHHWGFIDHQGRFVVPNIWEEIAAFDFRGLAEVRSGDRMHLVNRAGEIISPPKSSQLCEGQGEIRLANSRTRPMIVGCILSTDSTLADGERTFSCTQGFFFGRGHENQFRTSVDWVRRQLGLAVADNSYVYELINERRKESWRNDVVWSSDDFPEEFWFALASGISLLLLSIDGVIFLRRYRRLAGQTSEP